MPARRIVLAGFSQGCAVTLGAGLRHPERLAGLAGLSGYVPLADTTAAERHAANRDTPVFLAHGRSDGVVPLARGAAGPRPAAGPGPAGRVARLPDGALGVHGRGAGAEPVAAEGAGLRG